MMNWKGFGRDRSETNFKVLRRNSSGGINNNHETFQSEWPVSRPRFETEAFRIRSSSVNHSTTAFGKKYVDMEVKVPAFLTLTLYSGEWQA
jgi:hypothetical protein